jgi:sodium/potassium-transporting ATPase subunit alpha
VTTCGDDGAGFVWTKGAPESVMPLCASWDDGGVSRPLDEAALAMFRRAHQDMAERGLRVLALAWKRHDAAGGELEAGLALSGLVGLEDPLRPDVHDAVTRCHEAGVRVVMITGDHPQTAVAVAREVGIVRTPSPVVLTGDALRDAAARVQRALDAPEVVFARVSAEQKMQVVRRCTQGRHRRGHRRRGERRAGA